MKISSEQENRIHMSQARVTLNSENLPNTVAYAVPSETEVVKKRNDLTSHEETHKILDGIFEDNIPSAFYAVPPKTNARENDSSRMTIFLRSTITGQPGLPSTTKHISRNNKLNRDLFAQLEKFKKTPQKERWPGATWPTAQAFRDAAIFIRKLPLDSIPMPYIGLADDGEVNFLWKKDGVHVDLGFYGTRTYTYFAHGKDGHPIDGEDIPASEGLPSEIVELFTV